MLHTPGVYVTYSGGVYYTLLVYMLHTQVYILHTPGVYVTYSGGVYYTLLVYILHAPGVYVTNY